MRALRPLLGALVLGVTLAVPAVPGTEVAAAAPIKECGPAGPLYDGQVALYNVMGRKVACPKARRFARNSVYYGGPETAARGRERIKEVGAEFHNLAMRYSTPTSWSWCAPSGDVFSRTWE